MQKTNIPWATHTWNPVTGCLNGCPYCYAKKIMQRFGTEQERKFLPTFHPDRMNEAFPRNPATIFVGSMSDPQHWTEEWMLKIIGKIKEYPEHIFIMLTKGGFDTYMGYNFPENVITGVTVTSPREFPRKEAGRRFSSSNWLLNIEPLLGDLSGAYCIDHAQYFDWLIVGAETGNRNGKITPKWDWVSGIVNDFVRLGKPVFIKPSMKQYAPPSLYLQENMTKYGGDND